MSPTNTEFDMRHKSRVILDGNDRAGARAMLKATGFTDEDLKRRNIPTLPATLGEAIAEMQKDEVIREALGDHVAQKLAEAQTAEWDAFRKHVTGWERDRYLETY